MFGGDEEGLGETAVDTFRVEEGEEFYLVFEVGAGGVAKGVAAALVAAGEEFADGGRIVDCDAEFLANAFVPEFGEGFGELDAHAVEIKVFGVIAFFAEGVFIGGEEWADGDAGEGGDVHDAGIFRVEEVGEAPAFFVGLAGEVKAEFFLIGGFSGSVHIVNDQVVFVGLGGEVTVDNGGAADAEFDELGFDAVEDRADGLFGPGAEFVAGFVAGFELPLAAEEGDFVDVGEEFFDGDVFDDAGAEEGGRRDGDVARDIGDGEFGGGGAPRFA